MKTVPYIPKSTYKLYASNAKLTHLPVLFVSISPTKIIS